MFIIIAIAIVSNMAIRNGNPGEIGHKLKSLNSIVNSNSAIALNLNFFVLRIFNKVLNAFELFPS